MSMVDRATAWLLAQLGKAPDAALAGATPYLRLFAHAAGGCALTMLPSGRIARIGR